MREATLVLVAISLLSQPAFSGPSYINSHFEEIELTPAADRIAIVPADGFLIEEVLAVRDELVFDGRVRRHDCGLLEIPLAYEFRGRATRVTRQLEADGLVSRIGAVFSVPGDRRPVLLDRGVLVRLSGTPGTSPADLLAPTGLEVVRQLDRYGELFLCRAEDAMGALAASREASRLDTVIWALPDFLVPIEFYLQPNDTYYDEQWYHYQSSGAHIHSEEAWDVTTGDTQVIVSVIDTGLDEDHPDFASTNIVTGYDLPGNDSDPTPPADAMNAHGTCCSGEVAASIDNNEGMAGTCPGCSLMGIRMMDGWASMTEISDGYLAIEYATDNGAWVLSNSWGINQSATSQVDMQPFYDAVLDAVTNGRGGLGAVVLFASGNDGVAIGADELANMPEVMAVGGTDHTDTRVDYSNYGSNLSVVAPTGGSGSGDPQILTTDTIGDRGFSRDGTFWAPLMQGWDYDTGQPEPDSTGNYTRYFNGTSAACPIAAGVVGLVFSANPALTGAEARFVVEQTADKVGGVSYGTDGHHDYYGYGRVNAGRAARAAEIGFNNPLGHICAEDFNCSVDLCTKCSPTDYYGYCGECSYSPDGTNCDDCDLCTENDQCSGGDCAGTPVDCDDDNPCTDDACNPASGECVYTDNNDNCDDGDLCTEGDQCSGGDCAGMPIDCDDNNVCTDDSCNPANGECVYTDNSDYCDDDDLCTEGDQCSGGDCAGTPVDCDDNNVCTDDSCNPASGECVYTNNSDYCNDGNLCTEGDQCSGGDCVGTPVDCSDDNPCTDDSCNPADGECVHADNDEYCDDGDLCTENDQCSGGDCAGTPVDCNDDNVCTDDRCDPANGECVHADNDEYCDDGDLCTEGDQCSGGDCAGTPVDCDDDNVCTDDSCNPASGECVYTNNNDYCDDGDLCTENDQCSGGECAGTPVDCDDDNVCTDDACNPANGNCEHSNNTDFCDDGNACTADDQCSGGDCAGTAITCDDGNPCTDDSCDTQSGCVFTPNTVSCDDGNACTADDRCADGECSGYAIVCDDDNVCTDDSCDTETGCIFTPNTNNCDDGDTCTMNDICSGGSCGGEPLDADDDGHVPEACGGDDCDDSNATVNPGIFEGPFGEELCSDGLDNDCDGLTDEDDNGCAQCQSDSDCSDGNECNGQETCSDGLCRAGQPIDCDDGNVCTDDSCQPGQGCVNTPNDLPCDDGSVCTTGDVCEGGECRGTPVDCDDGNACTQDECDAQDGCVHDEIDCDDDNPCTEDSCDEAEGCVYENITGSCDDGNPCTEGDTCVDGDCVGGENTCDEVSGGCGCSQPAGGEKSFLLLALLGLILLNGRRRH